MALVRVLARALVRVRFAISYPAAVAAAAAAAFVLSSARNAAAFGGTADRLGQQGNFVISNRANLGFDQGLSYKGTSISLAPELDYFVIPNLSIGGAVAHPPPRRQTTHTTRIPLPIGHSLKPTLHDCYKALYANHDPKRQADTNGRSGWPFAAGITFPEVGDCA